MSTFTKLLVHIVFSTKKRERTLNLSRRDDILGYLCGILKNKDSHVFRINMTEDHVHIFCSFHQSNNVADLVKAIKVSSSNWMKTEKISPYFTGWQSGYGAFSISYGDKSELIEYIKNQQEHHKRLDFVTEFKKLLDEFGISYTDAYLE
ncbi:MAG: IS200/IS605 family transposase [Candidatus Cloacimonetes bacterium]|nr:IS200/IS605 family transposase [Candidatus Cloacimonadota bacterium]